MDQVLERYRERLILLLPDKSDEEFFANDKEEMSKVFSIRP